MAENVQCPVCTLYLHAGMNLSDHLETHPKEQVIKALVQLTISKVEDGEVLTTGEVTAAINTESSNNELHTAATKIEEDLITTPIKEEPQLKHANNISSKDKKTSALDVIGNTEKGKQQQQAYQKNVGELSTSTTNSEFENYVANNRYQQTTQIFPPTTSQSTFPNSERNQMPNTNTQHEFATTESNNSTHQHMPRTLLPPPPPPSPSTTTTNSAQFQNTALSFSNMQPQQQLHQQQHLLLTQRQVTPPTAAQQSPNLKIIYSPTLPPPPPLQLFSYQTVPQTTQHQKPPPAYVTAISQIRSQHNQTKNQLHSTQTQQITTATTTIGGTTTDTSSKVTATLTTNQNDLTNQNQRHMRAAQPTKQMQLYNSTAVAASTTPAVSTQTAIIAAPTKSTTTTTTIAGNLPQQATLITQEHATKQTNYIVNYKNNINSISVANLQTVATNNTEQTQTPTKSLAATSPSLNAVLRQSNSPFPTLVAASSPSSVLRYAESPVAHYLERDNGDFIVQETPKHIVECVETDNGEFSVIERIYQSPPSVLHIHEYDDDDDDDNDGEDNNEDEKPDIDKMEISIENSKLCNPEDEDEEDFMSIQTDTNEDEEEYDNMQKNKTARNIKNNKHAENIVTATTKTANIGTSINTTSTSTATSTPSPSSTTIIARKKSSKNSITVLSDVQLNLNEYLDLMGNIVASSKTSSTKTFSANLPIPMVKVEKEEPIDDYGITENTENYVKDLTTTTTTLSTKPPNKTISSYIKIHNSKRNYTKNNNNNNNKNKTDEFAKSNNSRQSKQMHKNEHKEDASNNDNEYSKSSYVTSVIRMVTTTTTTPTTPTNRQQPQHTNKQQLNTFNIEHVAEDLTQVKTEEEQEVLPPPPPLKKGPKKLIIKPKSTKTDHSSANTMADDEQPTTSAAAAAAKQHQQQKEHIEVKEEPTSNSILEQHLTRGQKHEVEDNKPLTGSGEGNVAEDARVLLEFAHSKKRLPVSSTNFLSSSSIFSNPDGRGLLRCESDFSPVEHNEANNAVQDIVISSSYASSQEATDIALNVTNVNTAEYPLGFHQHQQQTYDIPFTFLYGNGASANNASHAHSRAPNLSPLYQQTNDAGTTAATLASGSNSLATTLEDSSSTHTSRHQQAQQHHTQQWYQHVVNTANADFETALAADCNNADVLGSKYLDLDTCKRETISLVDSVQTIPSSTSTSSSFAAVTESSLAGGCTADALNIRTDEKMPAKGEISEQESNCDIENSWSQPVSCYYLFLQYFC